MKPLIVLLSVFVATLLASEILTGDWHLVFAGNIAMCGMLFLTSAGHFMFTRGMEMMIPPFIPAKRLLVYLSGVAEAVLGIALLIPAVRPAAAWLLILLFVLLLPANIRAAKKSVHLEKADYSGPGLAYLWFRIPEQLFFIGWVCFFSTGCWS